MGNPEAGSAENQLRASRLRGWRALSALLETRSYYLVYTALFALAAAVSFFPLLGSGLSFVWSTDGATQHLPALVYLRDWAPSALRSLMGETPDLPTWDMSIGLGGDMLTSLGFYGIGDVLNLLVLAVPREHVGIAYTGIALLRLYLSGIAFSLFARRFGARGYAVLTAALAYALSGFSLFMVLRHPHFTDPLIYLPLVCLGAQKVLDGESPLLFTVSLWLMFCAHFYLSYMVCIYAAGFVACRLAMGPRRSARDVASAVLRFCGLGALAACLAAPLLLPNALAVLDSSRAETGGYVPVLYQGSYYLELLPTLASVGFAGNQCYIGATQLGVLAAAFLFTQKGRAENTVKLALALLVASVLVPWAGHAMNGFFYVANRHSFGLVFTACGLIAWLLPRMLSADRAQLRALAAFGALYAAGVAAATAYAIVGGEAAANFGGSGAFLYAGRCVLVVAAVAATVLACAVASGNVPHVGARMRARFGNGAPRARAGSSAPVAAGAAVTACVLAGLMVAADGVGTSLAYRGLMLGFDDVAAVVADDPFADAANGGPSPDSNEGSGAGAEGSGEVYRYDSGSLPWGDGFSAEPATRANSGLIDGRYYDTQYFSLTPWSVSDFLSGEMEMGGYALSGHHYWTPDARASLLDLLSVRYWAGGGSRRAPTGFEQREGGFAENPQAVPFGFTYDRVISRESYDRLDAVDKQEALMSAGVVEDADAAVQAGLGREEPRSRAVELAVRATAEGSADMTAQGGVAVSPGDGPARVTLAFDAVSDVELYVELVGFAPERGAWRSVTVRARSGGDGAWCRFVPPGQQAYSAYDSGLLFLGRSDGERSQATLSLPSGYRYSFDAVRVWALSPEGHGELASALAESHLEDVEFGVNRIAGTIEADRPKLLCLSIPCSEGWSVQVDGRSAELMRVDTFMCGIAIGEGRHDVELRYSTPGLRAGAALFAFAALALAAAEAVRRIRRARAR